MKNNDDLKDFKGIENTEAKDASGNIINTQPALYNQRQTQSTSLQRRNDDAANAAPDTQKMHNENVPEKNEKKQHAPHLDEELTIGSNTSWNTTSKDGDADNEVAELAKAGKNKKNHKTTSYTEIESEETKARRIKQASAGDGW